MAFLRAMAGIVAAALVLGVAELIAVFTGSGSAPAYALGATVVDHTPDGVREWAISTFGTSDKAVLFVCMGIVAVVVAGLAGVAERTARPIGSVAFAVFGVVAAVIGAARVDGFAGALPALIGTAAGILALRALTRRIDDSADSPRATTEPVAPQQAAGRRRVLGGIAATGVLAVGAGLAGRLLGGARHDVTAERETVELPTATTPVPDLPPDADLRVPGLTSYITPNSDFYRIDTALIVPQVSTDSWSLRIHGMVDQEITLTWDDLLRRTPVERLVTLACVSNPINGDLIGNARWLGYRLDELLAEARPHPDADMVLSRSKDGWTAGSPLSVLIDGRDALLAIGMNGEPLPVRHGYPARLVVPGLYGYVSATKWVTELEVTRFDRATAYWTRRGWSAQGPIKTGTRIDTPRGRGRIPKGRTVIAGVAWAQHRGVTGVEVQVDNGDWRPARLSTEVTVDTWRQWTYDWDATPGQHTVRARALDPTGPQTAVSQDVVPDGATGYPTFTIQVN
ncbi:molybdopterin-dependent oxidoreductase [Nocardia alba]|uniref:DMSO/TMAO reductase YedYZ molybdopterin-dependent catalytic subunit n=1 Tax=Nocardia alba TaxID=225051 RepID=A0A4R1FWB7_9NOCA|nr:molybdopterin-dependent oxidoreductase [Nocardia alba]TCJ99756.1 DMSO/TMAO reductase YedYZ molybdopterin-dependent catalytic subunit [Nocardia alba]